MLYFDLKKRHFSLPLPPRHYRAYFLLACTRRLPATTMNELLHFECTLILIPFLYIHFFDDEDGE